MLNRATKPHSLLGFLLPSGLQKAKIHIGDKVPVITTTSTANVGVSQSVSSLDIGLKLDVEPGKFFVQGGELDEDCFAQFLLPVRRQADRDFVGCSEAP